MAAPAVIPWIQASENVVAENEANGLADVANRPAKFIITQSDLLETDQFPGFMVAYKGTVNPEGVQTGSTGASYIDTTAQVAYVKMTAGGNTGWRALLGNLSGNGSPEGVKTASIGALYEQRDAGATTNGTWVKRTGVGNTGWRAIGGFAGSAAGAIEIGTVANAGASAGAISIGRNSVLTGTGVVLGDGSSQAGGGGITIMGTYSVVGGSPSVCIVGSVSNAGNGTVICIGGQATTSTGVVQIGAAGSVTANNAIQIGSGSVAASGGVTVGGSITAAHTNSISIGNGCGSIAAQTFSVGSNAGGTPINQMVIGHGLDATANPTGVTFRLTNASGADNVAGNMIMRAGVSTGAGVPGDFQVQVSGILGTSSTLQTPVTRMAIRHTVTATHTYLMIYDVDNGVLERVTVGAPNSGGAGFKLLCIPN